MLQPGLVPPHRPPRSGDVLYVGPRASVQFAGDRAIVFRVVRVDPRPTYEGFVWLDGYELNPAGDAFQRREIFVLIDGLHDWASLRQAATLRRLEQERSAGSVPGAVERRAGKARNSRSPGGSAVRLVLVQG